MSAWNKFFGNKQEEVSKEKTPDAGVVGGAHAETPVDDKDNNIYNLEKNAGKCEDCDGTPVKVGDLPCGDKPEVHTETDDIHYAEKREVVYEEKLVCENTVLIHQADKIIGETDKIIGETGRIINAMRQSIKNQEAIYGLLQQMQRQVEENQRLSEIIKKQHETIARFQKDTLYYSQKDVIFEIIKIADEVEAIKEIGKNGGNLQEQVEGLSEFIDAGLTFSAVKSYRDADGVSKEFNPRRQELSNNCVVTHDPEKDGAIVSLRPGYIWRLPWLVANTDIQLGNFIKANMGNQTYEVLIRPEKVARMVYEME